MRIYTSLQRKEKASRVQSRPSDGAWTGAFPAKPPSLTERKDVRITHPAIVAIRKVARQDVFRAASNEQPLLSPTTSGA